jgi:hypothetical protein
MSPRVAHPLGVLFRGGLALACGPDGQVAAHELQGLFAGDTRVLSTYRLAINGRPWRLLGRSRPDTASGTWHFQNTAFMAGTGEVPPQSLHLRLERGLDDALHERLTVESFADRRLRATVSLHLDADFADLFEVKDQRLPPRPSVGRSGDAGHLRIAYERRGFQRALDVHVRCDGGAALVGTRLLFDLELRHGDTWTCELDLEPSGPGVVSSAGPSEGRRGDVVVDAPTLLREPFERGVADLRALEMRDDHGDVFLAGGAPWFLTLFGRDALLASVMGAVADDMVGASARSVGRRPASATTGGMPSRASCCTRSASASWPRPGRSRTPPTTARTTSRRCSPSRCGRRGAGPAIERSCRRTFRPPSVRCGGATSSGTATATACRSTGRGAAGGTSTRRGRTRATPS